MEKAEKLKNNLHKLVLYSLKVIPMLLAVLSLLNTILAYCYIDVPILSYIGGVSFLTLAFLYLTSYAFKFCEYHRMFLHYCVIINILNIIDYEYDIPIDTKSLFIVHMIITGVCLFLILYFKRCRI